MKWFNFFKRLREGNVYACTTGDFIGHMYMYIEKNNSCYGFLTIPTMEITWLPKDVFDSGVNGGILEFVERAPKDVRNICKIQFEENRKNL